MSLENRVQKELEGYLLPFNFPVIKAERIDNNTIRVHYCLGKSGEICELLLHRGSILFGKVKWATESFEE